MRTKLIKVEGGLAVTIPDSMLAGVGLSVGSEVTIVVTNKTIIIEAENKEEAIRNILRHRGKPLSDNQFNKLKREGKLTWDSFFNSDGSVSDDIF